MNQIINQTGGKIGSWLTIAALLFSIAQPLALPLTAVAAEPVTLFSDGFESNNFSNWTSVDSPKWLTGGNSSSSHSGSRKAEVEGGTGDHDDILKKVFLLLDIAILY